MQSIYGSHKYPSKCQVTHKVSLLLVLNVQVKSNYWCVISRRGLVITDSYFYIIRDSFWESSWEPRRIIEWATGTRSSTTLSIPQRVIRVVYFWTTGWSSCFTEVTIAHKRWWWGDIQRWLTAWAHGRGICIIITGISSKCPHMLPGVTVRDANSIYIVVINDSLILSMVG